MSRNGTVTSFHRVLIRIRWKEVTVPFPWHLPEVADTVFSTPDDGCVTPETCRVTWRWINVCILLHRVGPLLTLNLDARNHVLKKMNGYVTTTPVYNISVTETAYGRWRGHTVVSDNSSCSLCEWMRYQISYDSLVPMVLTNTLLFSAGLRWRSTLIMKIVGTICKTVLVPNAWD
jgi:hypothetical protein